MDPMQLQLMQEAGMGNVPGLPGLQAPMTGNGTQMLSALQGTYASPIAGAPIVDLSPLAPLNLQQYGLPGMAVSVAGNAYLTNMMTKQGLLPMGNAGSYMQAFRTRQLMEMRQAVSEQVAGNDAAGYYRTMRGAAAMVGMPFNQKQREAARNLSNTLASYGPMLAMAAPEFLDSIAGEKGSVQTLAAQMMEANRYRVDPTTGQMGFSTTSNTSMVNGVFDRMFADDNMAKMRGLRAGDVGQLYRSLSAEGLTGSTLSLRDRTINALQAARTEGTDLPALAAGVGVNINPGANLAGLTNTDLEKLRQSQPIQARMSKSDTQQITDRLQSYVGSIAAMREVFGENGDTNAPVPKLIGALKALTSGQLQRFDAAQLNTMVRDIQSMSQMSGKSIDQVVGMMQTANQTNTSMFGVNGVNFNPTAVGVGVTTGMAFAERGGATGFGAMNREQTEQAAMSYFSRGMNSEMGNSLGVLKRLEEAGGFSDNDAGKRLRAAMEAARSGSQTYVDPVTGKQMNVPTKEGEFRAMIAAGGASGVSAADFNMMLGDRTSNLRALSADAELQRAPMQQQNREIDKEIARMAGNRLDSSTAIRSQIDNEEGRAAASQAMGEAGVAALNTLTPEQLQNTDLRNKTIADAITAEAQKHGVKLSKDEALNMATGVYGQAENTSRRFGFQSHTAKQQTLGPHVSAARAAKQAQVQARSGLNSAMSKLGPSGGLLRRFVTAIQKQGEHGADADIDTLLGDMFAVGGGAAKEKLAGPMQSIKDKKQRIEELSGKLESATPAERQQLQAEIKQLTEQLDAEIDATRDLARSLGLDEDDDTFNTADIIHASDNARELEHGVRNERVAAFASTQPVSAEERAAVAAEAIGGAELQTIAAAEQHTRIEQAKRVAAGDSSDMPENAKELYDSLIARGVSPEVARKQVEKQLIAGVGDVGSIAKELGQTYAGMKIGQLSEREQNLLVGSRRGKDLIPEHDAVVERQKKLKELGAQGEYFEVFKLAEDQLLAENQLKAIGHLGKDGSLLSDDDIANSGMEDRLKQELLNLPADKRAAAVSNHFDWMLGSVQGSDARHFTKDGQQAEDAAERRFEALAEAREAYAGDENAIKRGGAAAEKNAKNSLEDEQTLRKNAEDYFGGDLGRMLATGAKTFDDAGREKLQQEFDALSPEERLKLGKDRFGQDQEIDFKDYLILKSFDIRSKLKSFSSSTLGLRTAAAADGTKGVRKTDGKPAGVAAGADAAGTALDPTSQLDADDAESRDASKSVTRAVDGVPAVNVAAEGQGAEERTLRISGGTIEVRGDITGQATVHELVAVGGSR
jgi:hypothetical protein